MFSNNYWVVKECPNRTDWSLISFSIITKSIQSFTTFKYSSTKLDFNLTLYYFNIPKDKIPIAKKGDPHSYCQ